MIESPGSLWGALPVQGRFVVLEHRVPTSDLWADHWDVMLETPAGLMTWASPPFPDQALDWEVRPLPVHRVIYLEYEGPITGNRGCVKRLDRGEFLVQDRQNNMVLLELAGQRFRGRLRIEVRMAGSVWFCWEEFPIKS
jgi:hypothetical protein